MRARGRLESLHVALIVAWSHWQSAKASTKTFEFGTSERAKWQEYVRKQKVLCQRAADELRGALKLCGYSL